MEATIFVMASRNPAILSLTLEGLAWSERPEHSVIVIIANDPGNPVIEETQRVADEFAATHDGFDVRRVEAKGVPAGSAPAGINGRGLAFYESQLAYPSDICVKLDDDMFPVVRDWFPRLVNTLLTEQTEIAVGMSNMNGMCAKAFVQDIGADWDAIGVGQERILYSDVVSQRKVWELTMQHWDRVVSWGERSHPVVRIEGFRNTNTVAITRGWLSRRTREDFYVVGEDERTLNNHKPEDCKTVVLDQSSLLLHWGYTPCRASIAYIWPELRRRLKELWCA